MICWLFKYVMTTEASSLFSEGREEGSVVAQEAWSTRLKTIEFVKFLRIELGGNNTLALIYAAKNSEYVI